jgi:uncharacterized damage-inducible protein DinB
MDVNIRKFLLRIIESRRLLWATIHALSDEELTTVRVEGVWTTKDLIGHITAWDISLLKPLMEYLEYGAFTPEMVPDHDAWNALQAAARKDRSLAETKNESSIVREELLATAIKLREPQWEEIFPAPWGGMETFTQMIDGLAWHEEEHTKSIQARFNMTK